MTTVLKKKVKLCGKTVEVKKQEKMNIRSHKIAGNVRFFTKTALFIVAMAFAAQAANAKVYYVSTTGSNSVYSGTYSRPFKDIGYALSKAQSGSTISVFAGNYPRITISGKKPAVAIRVKSFRGGKVTIKQSNSRKYLDKGIQVTNCKNLYFDDIDCTGFQAAYSIHGSTNIRLYNCLVYNLGLNAIHIAKGSKNCQVMNCEVRDTGKKSGSRMHGEGIYIGSASGRDHTSHITIRGCNIYRTSAEAIDIKGGSYDITVKDCHIHDIKLYTGAAIILRKNTFSNSSHKQSKIEDNRIENITTWTNWSEGNAILAKVNAFINNNRINKMQHRGLFLTPYKFFKIRATNNRVTNTGRAAIHIYTRSPFLGTVTLSGNTGAVQKD